MRAIHVRKFLILISFIAFLWFISRATLELINPQEGISFETIKNGEFPSITICPAMYLDGVAFQKFEDYQKLPSAVDYTSVHGTLINNGKM